MIRSSHGSKLLRRLMIGAIALLVPVVAGCEAGNNAPTLRFHNPGNGAYGTANDVSIINAFILGGKGITKLPAGASAGIFLGLYNGGSSPDKLVSVSAPGTAASAQLAGGSIALPSQQPTYLTGPHPKVILTKLTRPLRSGQTVNVVLTFASSGSVTLPLPVEPHADYYSTFSPPAGASTPAAKRTASGTAGAGAGAPGGGARPTARPGSPASPSPTPSK